MDYYGLAVLTHPIPNEYTPSSSRDDYHKINARLRPGYNPNWDPRFPDKNGEPGHNGDDIYATYGSDIFTPFTKQSEVFSAGWLNDLAGYGVELILPVEGGDLTYRGMHMSEVLVSKGQMVLPGTIIGKVGKSGPAVGQPGYIRSPHSHTDIAFYPGGMDRSKGMLAQPRLELDIRIFLDRAAMGGGGGAGFVWPEVLRLGDRHLAVRKWGGVLVALGMRNRTGRTKTFNEGHEADTMEFQKMRDLAVDGIVGPNTRAEALTVLGDLMG